MRLTTIHCLAAVAAVLSVPAAAAVGQSSVGVGPEHPATPVRDSSMLKPPPGAPVAIVEWEDMECPSCARAFPVVHMVMGQAKVPLVRYDCLIPSHHWSRAAAVFARYLQDKVSPELATQYRREVFAEQLKITSSADLDRFTREFMAVRKKPMPSVVDPTGALLKEVEADRDLGLKMGIRHTPTIFVVTEKHWIDVADVAQLPAALDAAKAEAAKDAAPVRKPAAHR